MSQSPILHEHHMPSVIKAQQSQRELKIQHFHLSRAKKTLTEGLLVISGELAKISVTLFDRQEKMLTDVFNFRVALKEKCKCFSGNVKL